MYGSACLVIVLSNAEYFHIRFEIANRLKGTAQFGQANGKTTFTDGVNRLFLIKENNIRFFQEIMLLLVTIHGKDKIFYLPCLQQMH